jgi:hypothetical protein
VTVGVSETRTEKTWMKVLMVLMGDCISAVPVNPPPWPQSQGPDGYFVHLRRRPASTEKLMAVDRKSNHIG